MRRRSLLVSGFSLPAALAGCTSPPATVVEVVDSGSIRFPLTPALIVPAVALPPSLAEREERTALADTALRAGIGERPIAAPAPDSTLIANARSRGLPRVVLLTVVDARRYRTGAFAPVTVAAAIRVRVLDTRLGWAVGQATFERRERGGQDIASAITALAAGLLA